MSCQIVPDGVCDQNADPESTISGPPVPTRVSYPDLTYTPSTRDYDCDYEAVMIALGDMNRLSRFLFRGGVVSQVHQQQDPTMSATREDVIEVLQELKEMMVRMFARFPERFR